VRIIRPRRWSSTTVDFTLLKMGVFNVQMCKKDVKRYIPLIQLSKIVVWDQTVSNYIAHCSISRRLNFGLEKSSFWGAYNPVRPLPVGKVDYRFVHRIRNRPGVDFAVHPALDGLQVRKRLVCRASEPWKPTAPT
jgi:hypothetical protein